MPLLMYRPKRGVFVGTWEEEVALIGTPDIWFKFEDLGTSLTNDGSLFTFGDGELDAGSATHTSGVPAAVGNGIDTNGTAYWAEIHSKAYQHVGTAILLVKANSDAQEQQWMGGWSDGFDMEALLFRRIGSSHAIIPNTFNVHFQQVQPGPDSGYFSALDSFPVDGNFHLFVVVFNGDGDFPDVYIDGQLDTPSRVDEVNVGHDPGDYTFTKFGINCRTGTSESSNNFDGVWDEYLYYEGVALTPAQIERLWLATGLAA